MKLRHILQKRGSVISLRYKLVTTSRREKSLIVTGLRWISKMCRSLCHWFIYIITESLRETQTINSPTKDRSASKAIYHEHLAMRVQPTPETLSILNTPLKWSISEEKLVEKKGKKEPNSSGVC